MFCFVLFVSWETEKNPAAMEWKASDRMIVEKNNNDVVETSVEKSKPRFQTICLMFVTVSYETK